MQKTFRWSTLIMALAAHSAQAHGLHLPALISDHMVLQSGVAAPLWGTDLPGELVKVEMAGKSASTLADSSGDWRLSLGALPAGGPHTLTVTGSDTLTVQDVLVGEVWLGSGQSNMEFAMAGTHDRETQIPAAKLPQIRLFYVERLASFQPKSSMDLRGSWKVCSPETVKDFSAVAYHFGKDIHQALKVPVGLITASWGGTPIENWVPRAELDTQADLAPLLAEWDADEARRELWSNGMPFDVQLKDLRFIPKESKDPVLSVRLSAADKGGLGGTWTHNEKPRSGGTWKDGRYQGVIQGGAWAGANTPLMPDGSPADLSAYESVEFMAKGRAQFALSLGQKNNKDPDHYGTPPMDLGADWKAFSVPLSSLKQGDWGEPKPFTPHEFVSLGIGIRVPYWPDLASVAYNAMIAPLQPYAIKGALWYQGESNAGRAKTYGATLQAMVKSWREAWGGAQFPFLVVQLPNYGKRCDAPCESDWADLRAAQEKVLELPQSGLVTTIDIGEATNIHPRNKTDVGKRLALTALNLSYGKKVEASGPRFVSLSRSGQALLAKFDRKDLLAKDGKLEGFELAGADKKFFRAEAAIKDGAVLISSSLVKDAKMVRYAWSDEPLASLSAANGFPAAPFEAELK